MNKTYLGILFTMILLVSVGSGLAAVNAGSWTSNSQKSISINVGESTEFSYGVTAVTSYGGKYSIALYAEGNPTPIHTYVSLTPTIGNGALGTFTVAPAHYNNAAGSYYVLIYSSDKFSNATLKLYLTTTPIIIPPNPLVVSCSASQTLGYVPLTTAFISAVSGGTGTYTYLWNFGDTTTSTSATGVSHTYNTANVYQTSLTITDSNNNKVTANCGTITVNAVIPNPIVASCSATPLTGYAPLTSTFSSSVSGGSGVYTYLWNFGDSTTSASTSGVSHLYNTPNTYATSLTITDSNNQKVTVSCGTITVNTVPPAPLVVSCSATPSIGFAPVTSAFSSTVSGGSGTYVYSWNFGDGTTSASTSGVSHLYNTPNTYQTTLTITDSNNQKVTADCGKVIVNKVIPNPLTTKCFSTPKSGTAPLDVAFDSETSGGTGPYSYEWNFGDNVKITDVYKNILAYTYYNAGTYYASLTVTDADGNKATASCGTITVNAVIPTLTASCNVAPSTGFAPLTTAFTSAVSGGTGVYTYLWNFGDGTTGNSVTSANHLYNIANTYATTLTITDSSNNKVTANCGTVNVNAPIPTLTASCSATPLTGFAPVTSAFSSTVSGGTGTYTYLWNFGDTTTSTSATGVSHTYNTANVYQTSLTITDSSNNKVTANCGTIIVNAVIVPPTVSCTATPTSGTSPLNVAFNAVVTGSTAPNTYNFIFDDGQSSTVTSATNTGTTTHTYNIGNFVPRVIVTDANNKVATANCGVNGITVTAPVLNVDSITCFPRIVDGHNQSCSVFVSSNNGQVAGNVNVNIYYLNGTLFGTCTTDRLSGGCEVKNVVNGVNKYTVYATATGNGYISDTNTYPRYTFDVYAQRYHILNLGTYNDSNFMYPDDTFYRGEPLYAKFQVYDPDTNSFVTNDIVTAASLISLPGGRVDLSRMTYNGNWYYYRLNAIPLTHDFLGDSNVFAFAFNFTGLTGGQAQVSLTILNNKPTISNIADIYVNVGQSHSIFLNNYGTDLEDHTLRWNITSTSSLFNADILTGNVLSITGLNPGNATLTLRGYDLDDDYANTIINVHVLPGIITNNLTASCTPTPTNGNIPLNVQFDSEAIGGTGPYTYVWLFGDGQSATTPSTTDADLIFTHTYSTAGLFSASLTITDANNKVATTSCGTINASTPIIPPNPLVVSCSATPNSGDAPLTSVFSSAVSGGTGTYTYLWNFGDSTTNTNPSTTSHTYSTAGTYGSTLTVTDAANNVASANCGAITVTKPAITLDITCFTLPNIGVVPLDVSVIAIVNNGIGPYNFAFDFDNGVSVNDATSAIFSTQYTTYNLVGTYYPSITVTDFDGNTGSATCGFVIANANNSNITFPIANAGGPYTGYVNEPVTFDASASIGSILNYRWDFGDGTGTFDTTSPTIEHTYSKIDRYDVKLIVFDSNGYVVDTKTTATIIERTTPKPVIVRDLPDKGIAINSILLYGQNGEILNSNDELTAQIKLKNNWDRKLKNVKVIVSIPELGLESRSSAFDFSRGSERNEMVVLPLYDVPKGVYYVKILVDSDEGLEQVKRIKYREIIVK